MAGRKSAGRCFESPNPASSGVKVCEAKKWCRMEFHTLICCTSSV